MSASSERAVPETDNASDEIVTVLPASSYTIVHDDTSAAPMLDLDSRYVGYTAQTAVAVASVQEEETPTVLEQSSFAPTQQLPPQYHQAQQQQQPQEELTALERLPTAGVAVPQHASVMEDCLPNNEEGTNNEYCSTYYMDDDDDDDEALALQKRQALYGTEVPTAAQPKAEPNIDTAAAAAASSSDDDWEIPPDQEPPPEPLPGEDFATFFGRTIDHWNVWAAERLTAENDDNPSVELTLATLEAESTRLASQQWHQAQNIVATASAVAVPQAQWVGPHNDRDGKPTAVASAAIMDATVATEATVLDTAPLDKQSDRSDYGLWGLPTPEAQVLIGSVDDPRPPEDNDRKPAARRTMVSSEHSNDDRVQPDSATTATGASVYATGNMPSTAAAAAATTTATASHYASAAPTSAADAEGLVVSIEENVHPADNDYPMSSQHADMVGTTAYAVSSAVAASSVHEPPALCDNDEASVHAVVVESVPETAYTAEAQSCPAPIAATTATILLPSESITVAEYTDNNNGDVSDDIDVPPLKEAPWSGPVPSSRGPVSTTPLPEPDSAVAPATPIETVNGEPTTCGVPLGDTFAGAPREQSTASGTSERSSSSQRSQLHNISSNIARGTGNVMDALFGDTKGPFTGRKSRASESEVSSSVHPRTLLPWSVIYSATNEMWVATLQTSQKALDSNNITEASKALRAFSLPTEMQAVSLARAWTPPRMMPFAENNSCHICKAKFAVFRRACHCRNCGVCVCKDCTVQWPSNMVPDTYNSKGEAYVNACRSCDWMSNSFRLALLNGDMDGAVALHTTGNINVTCPFSNVKGELFYPVHCAVLGGNLQLLKWLVDEQCCPIKSVRVSGKSRDSAGRYTPIVTSKGRSLLGIAMENCYEQIIRYLVVKKGIVIAGERDITHDMLARNLTRVLRILPDGDRPLVDDHDESQATESGADVTVTDHSIMSPSVPDPDNNVRSLSDGARDFGAIYQHSQAPQGADEFGECIICFDAMIDCVATPCGHQMCCSKCSQNVSRCPVCAQDCTFMRVFKP